MKKVIYTLICSLLFAFVFSTYCHGQTTKKDGLCDNQIFLIFEDKAGNIWLGTRNTELCRFNGKTFTSFSESLF